MPALEVFDTVVLKANRQLVGIVDRTYYEVHDPLEDILIIAHVPVDEQILTKFVLTGVPPKNHVFVRFSDEALGSSLVNEEDVILLDRSFNLGDVVKKEHGQMLGTVTGVSETYIIQPVWLNKVNPSDRSLSAITVDQIMQESRHACSSECPFGILSEVDHPWQSCLLHNIPGEELKKAEDVLEADYIVQDDWVGIAEELELMVIVLLEDESIVVVKEPDELYIPVVDSGKPLVSLPEFDNLARPDPLVALQGWSATIPPHDFQCGQMVITNQRNIRLGRWLRGSYNPNIKPQGRILDVRTRSVDVRWLACNAFSPVDALGPHQPHAHTSLYDNINTFPRRSELRINKQICILDSSRFPRAVESRVRHEEADAPAFPSIRTPTDFQVGDNVKFRDQAGAALKYQGVTSKEGVVHGRFDRVASTTTYGFDVNEFRIIRSQQSSMVMWQDGTSSTQPSTSLFKFTLFEPELAPADIVVAREGMKQVLATPGSRTSVESKTDFNEMKFFESPHDLIPRRVGIVQSVNQEDRIAQVRWFADPRLLLFNYGHQLTSDSRFGKLSTEVEDMSLYEIMTFPALMHRLKDLIIIPPSSISSVAVDIMNHHRSGAVHPYRPMGTYGHAALSQLNLFGTVDFLDGLQKVASEVTRDMVSFKVFDPISYKLHPATDWIGEIVNLGLDGIITVRLNTRSTCKDVRIEHDQIICLLDDAAIGGADPFHDQVTEGTDMDMSIDGSDDVDTASTISETVEYEGGERIDNDSGDENWEDADEDEMLMDEKPTPILSTTSITPPADMPEAQDDAEMTTEDTGRVSSSDVLQKPRMEFAGSITSLKKHLPPVEPSSFLVLEREPPNDQYQDHKDSPTTAPTFLKRIVKEHRILASSLPKGEIFVRTYENRLDLMRCLILGPADTPYEHAPFLIDLQLGKNFPREPPVAHFHSWTSGLGRINPNLYEEGKICLSLLGTWQGKAETENWSDKATILQLLVSIQGLVFVRQPFYNEAGFEGYAEDNSYNLEALRYNEKAYVMARGFVKHAVTAPVQGLEDTLAWVYVPRDGHQGLVRTIISQSSDLIDKSEQGLPDDVLVDGTGSNEDPTKVFLRPLSRGAIVMLKKTIRSLEDLLASATEDVDMTDNPS